MKFFDKVIYKKLCSKVVFFYFFLLFGVMSELALLLNFYPRECKKL